MTRNLTGPMVNALRYVAEAGDVDLTPPSTGTRAALVTRGLLTPAAVLSRHELTEAGRDAHETAEVHRLGYADVAAYLAAPGRTRADVAVVADETEEHTNATCPDTACTSFHTDETVEAWAARAYGPDTCDHGVSLDDPCGPCAVANHEPVDLPAADEPAGEDSDDFPAFDVAADEARAAAITAADADDDCGHLADCLPCFLRLPVPHAYESIIDVPPTLDQLRTLADRTDVTAEVRAEATDTIEHTLADLAADVAWQAYRVARGDAGAVTHRDAATTALAAAAATVAAWPTPATA